MPHNCSAGGRLGGTSEFRHWQSTRCDDPDRPAVLRSADSDEPLSHLALLRSSSADALAEPGCLTRWPSQAVDALAEPGDDARGRASGDNGS
eukprot:9476022-Pyramimonas_sp.AAC.2